MTASEGFEIQFSSIRKNVSLVEPFLKSIERFRNLEESRYYNSLIAITEAVNNAIVHGNDCDESKLVWLSVSSSPEGLIVSVRDEGSGFDPDDVPDPRRKENLLKDGGRGVFLIHSLVDDVSYLNTGAGMVLAMTIKT